MLYNQILIEHIEILELHSSTVDPLCTLFIVPCIEVCEEGKGVCTTALSVNFGEVFLENPDAKPTLKYINI